MTNILSSIGKAILLRICAVFIALIIVSILAGTGIIKIGKTYKDYLPNYQVPVSYRYNITVVFDNYEPTQMGNMNITLYGDSGKIFSIKSL